jgi:hypothetical protein
MKVAIDVPSLFQEESLKIKNNQLILPHTAILERVRLKISESAADQLQ